MIDQTAGDTDTLIVRGVSARDFDEINREREHRGRRFRLRRFVANSKILIITIPTDLHEKLHTWIWENLRQSMVQMGLRDDWNTMGSKTLRAQGNPGGDGGEGDSTGGPKPQRRFKGSWPTLVVEAGDSETLGELRNDMRLWFSMSNHQVKIVLLAKFDQNRIILEKWIEIQAPTRTGATTTRTGATTTRAAAQGILQPVLDCDQVITITRDPGVTDTDPNRFLPRSYIVTSDLRLEFDRLFLRGQEQGEGDIIISIEELQVYAGDVWQVQEEEEEEEEKDNDEEED